MSILKETTLCYLQRGECWLMMHRTKKQNDNSAGKWIGVGGKVEPGETPEQCIEREVTEETGLRMLEYVKRARIEFHSDIYEDEIMHVYTCEEFVEVSEPTDDEGDLEWIPVSRLDELPMWEGDKLFYTRILNGDPYFEMSLSYEGDKLAQAVISE